MRFGQDSLWKIRVIVEKLSPTSLLSMSVRNQSSIDFADLGEIWSRLFVENKRVRALLNGAAKFLLLVKYC